MKIQISLSNDVFQFKYAAFGTTGTVLAATVKSALSQARMDWAKQNRGSASRRKMQSQGDRSIQDTDIVLKCDAASDEAIANLRRRIHVLATEVNLPTASQEVLLSKLVQINHELKQRTK